MLQCGALWCNVVQCVAVCCSVLQHMNTSHVARLLEAVTYVQCGAVRCSALPCVAMCCRVSQCVAVCRSVSQCVAVCRSVLRHMDTGGKIPGVVCCIEFAYVTRLLEAIPHVQCVAVCCSVLQSIGTCCSVLHRARICNPTPGGYFTGAVRWSVVECGGVWWMVLHGVGM